MNNLPEQFEVVIDKELVERSERFPDTGKCPLATYASEILKVHVNVSTSVIDTYNATLRRWVPTYRLYRASFGYTEYKEAAAGKTFRAMARRIKQGYSIINQ